MVGVRGRAPRRRSWFSADFKAPLLSVSSSCMSSASGSRGACLCIRVPIFFMVPEIRADLGACLRLALVLVRCRIRLVASRGVSWRFLDWCPALVIEAG